MRVDAPSSAGRRLLLGAAAFLTLPPPEIALGAAGLSRDDIDKRLSRVPVFCVTNKEAAPYLTEMSAAGKRSGFFFLSPQDAVEALNDIKAFDPRASLNVLPLDQVWYDVAKTVAEADAAPQPTAGTSTDMRLFRLRPLDSELEAATRFPSGPAAIKDEGAIPLFYEPSFKLAIDGREQQPYFFRLNDLATAYEAQAQAGAQGMNDPPKPAVASLTSIVNGWQTGTLPADALLVAASEASAVVQRMTNGEGLGAAPGAGGGGAPARVGADPSSGAAPGAPAALQGGAPFYLNVPFGGGAQAKRFFFF